MAIAFARETRKRSAGSQAVFQYLSIGTLKEQMNQLAHLIRVDKSKIQVRIKSKITYYSTHAELYIPIEPIIKIPPAFEPSQTHKTSNRGKSMNRQESLQSSSARSKRNMMKLVLVNQFTHFFTPTFGHNFCPKPCPKTPEHCTRYNHELLRDKLRNWLKAMKRKYPDFEYIVVFEKHKDGALHVHGVYKGYTGPLIQQIATKGPQKGKQKLDESGRPVFTLGDYKFGFCDVTEIGDLEKTANYLRKYMSKEWSTEGGGQSVRPETLLG